MPIRAGVLVVLSILCLCFEFDSTRQAEWIDSDGNSLDGAKHGLAFYSPAHQGAAAAEDMAKFKIRLTGFEGRPSARLSVVSVDPQTGFERDRLDLGTLAEDQSGLLHSPWLVLVSSLTDKNSLALVGSVVYARPGDAIEARVRVGGAVAEVWTLPVGRPAQESGPLAVKNIDLHVTVLAQSPEGPPIFGGDAKGVQVAIEHQVGILNEVLAQCFIRASLSGYHKVSIKYPPSSSLVAVGERFGLPSSGGLVRLVVDGEPYGPWKVGRGFTPAETARLISHNLNQSGFVTNVSTNKRPISYALDTADIIVWRKDGTYATVGPWSGEPLFTDARQSLDIGSVNLTDGIDAYDENNTASGTLEERTLIKTLEDSSPATVEVFVINHFGPAPKQGESFIEASESSLKNAVILNLDALVRARHAYTLPHEIGHILLGDLGHPDDYGHARTDLLMHSSSSSAMDGPKRLTKQECAKIRSVSAYLFH